MGRQLQKKQTGFVHFCKESDDLVTHDTIPVLENALFALSLFRSRLADNVLEGKALIEKLLPFEIEGNFPVYLHDYPRCFDPYLGLRLYPILFWLTVDFGHVIGDLKEELVSAMERIIEAAKKQDLPEWAVQRVRAIEGKTVEVGANLDEALITLQIAEKQGYSIDSQLQEAASYWHPELQLYIGPASQRHQMGEMPEVTLYDLYMCSWQKEFPKRVARPHPIHLKGALIRPLAVELPSASKPVPFVHFNPEDEIPLWIAWGCHTFILSNKHLDITGSSEELILTPTGEDEMVVNFYLDHHQDHDLSIDGTKASVFRKGQELKIESIGTTLCLTFDSDDGVYAGHLMRGNRPCQHACRGDNLYRSYDWRIAIRAVQPGSKPIRVKLRLEKGKESQQPLPLHASHYPHTE